MDDYEWEDFLTRSYRRTAELDAERLVAGGGVTDGYAEPIHEVPRRRGRRLIRGIVFFGLPFLGLVYLALLLAGVE